MGVHSQPPYALTGAHLTRDSPPNPSAPMPRLRLPLAAFLFAALALAACRDEGLGPFGVADVALDVVSTGAAFVPVLDGPLRVLSATPFGDAVSRDLRQPVAVTFSKPMVPLGDAPAPDAGALRVALDGRDVDGTLRWEGSQTLVFTPAEPLPRATGFTAVLAAGLESLDGEALNEAYAWTFETPRPQFVASVPARGEAHAEPTGAIRLRYDQAVRGDRAGDQIQVTADGLAVRTRVASVGDSTLSIEPTGGLRRGTAYVVRILPGVPAVSGPLGSADTTLVRFRTYGDLTLDALQQTGDYGQVRTDGPFDPKAGIELGFSNPVTFEQARTAVTLSPAAALPAGVEAGDGRRGMRHTLPFRLAPETSYTVTVRGLKDVFGQTLGEATRTFRTGPYAPDLAVPEGIVVVEADEERALPIRATNVPTVRVGLQRLGPDTIVPALRAHDQRHYYGAIDDDEEPTPIAARDTLLIPLLRNTPGTVPLRLDPVLRGQTGVVAVRVVSDHPPQAERAAHRGRRARRRPGDALGADGQV